MYMSVTIDIACSFFRFLSFFDEIHHLYIFSSAAAVYLFIGSNSPSGVEAHSGFYVTIIHTAYENFYDWNWTNVSITVKNILNIRDLCIITQAVYYSMVMHRQRHQLYVGYLWYRVMATCKQTYTNLKQCIRVPIYSHLKIFTRSSFNYWQMSELKKYFKFGGLLICWLVGFYMVLLITFYWITM